MGEGRGAEIVQYAAAAQEDGCQRIVIYMGHACTYKRVDTYGGGGGSLAEAEADFDLLRRPIVILEGPQRDTIQSPPNPSAHPALPEYLNILVEDYNHLASTSPGMSIARAQLDRGWSVRHEACRTGAARRNWQHSAQHSAQATQVMQIVKK